MIGFAKCEVLFGSHRVMLLGNSLDPGGRGMMRTTLKYFILQISKILIAYSNVVYYLVKYYLVKY